jgi:drug/metabolite transporter (DMT)-like permease
MEVKGQRARWKTLLAGYFLGGEAMGLRTILGTLCVLISVVMITTTRAKTPVTTAPPKNK